MKQDFVKDVHHWVEQRDVISKSPTSSLRLPPQVSTLFSPLYIPCSLYHSAIAPTLPCLPTYACCHHSHFVQLTFTLFWSHLSHHFLGKDFYGLLGFVTLARSLPPNHLFLQVHTLSNLDSYTIIILYLFIICTYTLDLKLWGFSPYSIFLVHGI